MQEKCLNKNTNSNHMYSGCYFLMKILIEINLILIKKFLKTVVKNKRYWYTYDIEMIIIDITEEILKEVLFMEEENKVTNESEEITITESTESNEIKIADDVVAVIAGVAVSEVPGVAEMAGGFAGGITEVLSGKKNLAKGIKVEVGEKETKIDVNILVEYGVRIPDVAFEIQNRVKKAVETMTGLKVIEVNVHVQGVSTETEETQNTEE